MAIVSSICVLLQAASRAALRYRGEQKSNGCATDEAQQRRVVACAITLVLAAFAATTISAAAQDARPAQHAAAAPGENRAATIGLFLAGGALGLGAHEGGHVLFDIAFDADPGIRKVDFHGIPFFAITHRPGISPRRAFTIASAGFWVQHAGSEWLLTRRPRLRHERAPLAKGILAFNILASAAYSSAAFARTGPDERDTRGIAQSVRMDERWVGAVILAPALLDSWRYYRPDSKWAVWTSRGVKAGMVLLIVR
jgi:hypothetical protein